MPTVEGTFSARLASVPAVRRFVAESMPHLPRSVLDTVRLLVSELATNAVLHAGTSLTVRVQYSSDSLLVAVTDEGTDMPHVQPLPEPTDPHGRGLIIVQELADEWGITSENGRSGKTVWFRIDLRDRHGVPA